MIVYFFFVFEATVYFSKCNVRFSIIYLLSYLFIIIWIFCIHFKLLNFNKFCNYTIYFEDEKAVTPFNIVVIDNKKKYVN